MIDDPSYREYLREHSAEVNVFYGVVGLNDYLVNRGRPSLFCVPIDIRCDVKKIIDLVGEEKKARRYTDDIKHEFGPTYSEYVAAILMNKFPCGEAGKKNG